MLCFHSSNDRTTSAYVLDAHTHRMPYRTVGGFPGGYQGKDSQRFEALRTSGGDDAVADA
jgi:hypothetical protein